MVNVNKLNFEWNEGREVFMGLCKKCNEEIINNDWKHCPSCGVSTN